MKPFISNYKIIRLSLFIVKDSIELSKPFLSENDYCFFKRVLNDIDLNKLPINIMKYLNFIMRELDKHSKFK